MLLESVVAVLSDDSGGQRLLQKILLIAIDSADLQDCSTREVILFRDSIKFQHRINVTSGVVCFIHANQSPYRDPIKS